MLTNLPIATSIMQWAVYIHCFSFSRLVCVFFQIYDVVNESFKPIIVFCLNYYVVQIQHKLELKPVKIHLNIH